MRHGTQQRQLTEVALFGHREKAVVDASSIFKINSQPMRALSQEDSWTYLRIEFSAEGLRHQPLVGLLNPYLQRVIKAQFKPYQRLYALKTTGLPKVYYHKALGRTAVN